MKKTLISLAVAGALFGATVAHADTVVLNGQLSAFAPAIAASTNVVVGASAISDVEIDNVEISNTAINNNLSVEDASGDARVRNVQLTGRSVAVAVSRNAVVGVAGGISDEVDIEDVTISNAAVNNNASVEAGDDARVRNLQATGRSAAVAASRNTVLGFAPGFSSDVDIDDVEISNTAINNNLSVTVGDDAFVATGQLALGTAAIAVSSNTVIGGAHGGVSINGVSISNAAVGNNVSVTAN